MGWREYTSLRRIRGALRSVHVKSWSENGKRKEKIELMDKKRPRALNRPLTRAEARDFHNTRSNRAKALDAKNTSKLSNKERWKKYPHKYDFPGVDTKGVGGNAGKGYGWKAEKKKKKR